MCKISVIVPVYNVEKYLSRCLDSILNQTFKDFEIICVNDGSPDNSHLILEEYAKKDKRIKVFEKENGGLSDARNFGLSKTSGEYIIFVDSDDFIHYQTLEISYKLLLRDNSDIVSWYKDKLFRPQSLLKYKLGINIDNFVPKRINKKYDISKIKSYKTEDIFNHVSENSHSRKKWVVKHFFVWRHLIRKDLIKDIKFIKGLLFEDFPWWSEVLLKKPVVTITKLPFYFYFPNFNSIDLNSSRIKKMKNWIKGLDYIFNIYKNRASDYEMKMWSKECKWQVIFYHISKRIELAKDDDEIKIILKKLYNDGAFNDASTNKEIRAKQKLEYFINN